MDYLSESLKKHAEWKGKLEVVARAKVDDKEKLSLAYTPGVAQPCLEIQKDISKSYELTRRWNMVAVITDGTAVLGLGDIGPEAGMPVMEGKCVLFKEFGGVDAFPLCIKSKDVDEIVRTCQLISGSFGGINLEDISAPRCFEIEEKLKACTDIPIFHDDQHGTAIICAGALVNALKLVGKKFEDCTVAFSGAGAAGVAIAKLLKKFGVKDIFVCDRKGIICDGDDLAPGKQMIADFTNAEHRRGTLADAMKGADIFVGVSAAGVVTQDMIRSMNKDAIVLAMANPVPEIMPDLAKEAGAAVVGSKQQYIKKTGRVRGEDDVIAYHLRQSFRPGEITQEEANRLGCELARRFTKGNHAFIVCTHIDKAHIHNHIIWNSTALDESRKFRNFWGSTRAIRRLNDTICVQNGYSIVENPKAKGRSYDKWLGDKKKPSHRERICFAIDDALTKNPESFDALLELLYQAGYEIKQGKVPSLRAIEQKNFIRMDTLGAGYSPDELQSIIAGTQTHIPRKRSVLDTPAKPSGSLLIDIQAKLQEGKGAGYAKWAKSFNLKQMSQTMIYLEENGLLDLDTLNAQAAAASATYHDLSKKIKSAEQRMTEIKILQQHIVNYSKTRNVYVGYRKAGYSKKYLAEHEADILLHKAAKKYFDDQGLEKLPTFKRLQSEYFELMAQKKSMYSNYKKAQERMRELQTAKANVDKILNMEISESEKEKETEQR